MSNPAGRCPDNRKIKAEGQPGSPVALADRREKRGDQENEGEISNFHMIGNLFRFLRRTQKRTLKDVSEATGLSVSFICDVEKGRTPPSLATVEKLADAYGVTAEIVLRPKLKG